MSAAEDPKKKPDAAADKKGDGKEKDDGHGKKAGGGIVGMLTKLPVLVGGIMLIEAVVLFAGMKFLGGSPSKANGATLTKTEGEGDGAEEAATKDEASAAEGHKEGEEPAKAEGGKEEGGEKAAAPKKPLDKKRPVELQVVDLRAYNKVSGRTLFFDVSIYVVTRGEKEAKLKDKLKDREMLIRDRLRTIISQMDPEKIGGSEPGLETLRRQIKYQLEEIVGEGMIDEILVPRCIPIRFDM